FGPNGGCSPNFAARPNLSLSFGSPSNLSRTAYVRESFSQFLHRYGMNRSRDSPALNHSELPTRVKMRSPEHVFDEQYKTKAGKLMLRETLFPTVTVE